ncbi:cytochrome oxidase putative small subunit CydP [Zoogloea sp.]|uniref:cytochrome oxidase putative small subunit CydP n=1 Tax=Zoogloea sp. TaxID=49181 RepID=UPI001AD2C39A|nr:cytochrome oxidase putative small subunit CydP [Zoogloea sp.]MBN8284623.1 hypothetical protein [Zoogloea sp.]
MTPSDSLLRRHLGWVLVIKLFALFALWWFFVRDSTTQVDPAALSWQFTPNPVVQGAPHGQ